MPLPTVDAVLEKEARLLYHSSQTAADALAKAAEEAEQKGDVELAPTHAT